MFINIFCHYIFQILVYFLCTNCNSPLKKVTPLSQQSLSKNEILSSPILLEIWLEAQSPTPPTPSPPYSPPAERGVQKSAHYDDRHINVLMLLCSKRLATLPWQSWLTRHPSKFEILLDNQPAITLANVFQGQTTSETGIN